MKKTLIVIAFLLVLNLLRAQSSGNGVIVLTTAGAPSSCAWPTGATWTNAMALCGTNAGLYWALNGGTFGPATNNGVASYNGRTGNVLPAPNDYKFSDLAAKPTALNCSTATHQNTGLQASGCVFQ